MAASKRRAFRRGSQMAGFTLIEILVTLLIVVLGLLGLAGLQARIQQAEFESYQRGQALILLYDMVDRIQLNRATVDCFAFTNDLTNGAPYLGVDGATLTACSASSANNNNMADAARSEWDGLLKGAAETKGGVSVGAMIGARGCVSYDATTELVNPATGGLIDGTGIYTVAVAWQGTVDTFAPTVACANNLYGTEAKRRVVSATFRLASLP